MEFKITCPMAPAWCVQCDPWKGSWCAYGEKTLWTRQDGRRSLGRWLGKPAGNLRSIFCFYQKQGATGCAWCAKCIAHSASSDSSSEEGQLIRQQLLRKTFCHDHIRWWDKRHRRKYPPRPPDFRCKGSGEAVWRINCYKFARVDAQLAILNEPMDYAASPSSLSPDHAVQLVGPPGYESHSTPEFVKQLCKQGKTKRAFEVLEASVGTTNSGIDKYLLYNVLKECTAKKDLMLGIQVHALAVKMGFGSDKFLCNNFIRMYAAHGKLREAIDVFEGVAVPDAFMWSTIISAHTKQGQPERAIELYQQMRATRTNPDNHVFVAALQACATARDLLSGKQLHSQIKERQLESDMFVGGSLVNMYSKCGSFKDARTVFDGLSEKSVVTWTAMIAGYAKVEGMGQDALSLYSLMHKEGLAIPDAVTFVCLLQACANVGVFALEKGKQLHSELKDRRLESDMAVAGSLVNMYTKCGSLKDARTVFDGLREKSVVTWTAMIAGYAKTEGMGQEALSLYSSMHDEGIAIPDAMTFVCLLQACANVGVSTLGKGKQLHLELIERGFESNMVVAGSLVNMYAKCGSLKDARVVFDGLSDKNVLTWTAMIAGYAQQAGMGQEALNIYSTMRSKGLGIPDAVTYVCLLEACVNVGALQQGKELHAEILEGGFDSDALIGTCLVNMYAQCGRLEVSRHIFDRLPVKGVETWTALLKGYAEHGDGGMAIKCFEELLEQGIQPNEVTYICLLTACSHAGLVEEGQRYFETMEEQHGVQPDEWHYTCMVDLLGRSGHLDRAEQMLRAADLAGNVVSWTALLSACKSFGDADLGRRCFDSLVSLQPTVATAYVLLGSIYASAGRWDEVERVEKWRKTAGASKKAAKACIEVDKEVLEFTVGEERSDVAAALRKMNTSVKEGGHVPQTQLILRAASEQEKEDALCGHAEKLALAYGLLQTPAGSPVLVTKNLRMCDDCHSSTKIMSRVEKREIVVRDCSKVHRFQNGACSCQDRP